MLRLFLAIAATISSVVFVMANTHHVRISFIFGSPVQVRLIFLLMITFVAGAVVSSFFTMISKLRFHRRVTKHLRREANQQPPAHEIEDDDLVTEWAGE